MKTKKPTLRINNHATQWENLPKYFDEITEHGETVTLLLKKTADGFTVKDFIYINAGKKEK